MSGSLLEAYVTNCSGAGSVSGTGTGQNVSGAINGQNVSLNLNQSGAVIGLTGTASSGTGGSMTGNFTSQPGVCSFIPSSGTWSAVQVAPIAGSFHGTFSSGSGALANVKGTLSQGPNTGYSTATLSGTLTPTSGATFCSYVLPGTITGLISGTAISLNLYDESGNEYAQLGQIGANPTVTVTPDGSSVNGTYLFNALSDSCPSAQGNFTLSFP
jgi:hypothetical protein